MNQGAPARSRGISFSKKGAARRRYALQKEAEIQGGYNGGSYLQTQAWNQVTVVGLTVTGVGLVSVLQCCCIQLLPGTADSSALHAKGESVNKPRQTFSNIYLKTSRNYLPLPFAPPLRCVLLVVFVIQVIEEVVWL